MNITSQDLQNFSHTFNKDEQNELLKNAVSNNRLKSLVVNRDKVQNRNHVFSKKIDIKVKNTDQKDSGRCWIFALLNLMRFQMIKKYKLDEDFEFSQNYLFFYDKLEKANYFLHNIMETKDQPNDSRIFEFLMSPPVDDGGQWNMLVNLVLKYGVIPKSSMNETYASSRSNELSNVLNERLKTFAFEIRSGKGSKKIEKYMEEVYKILVIFLGEPPQKLTWEYYSGNKDKKKYKVIKDITPLDFYRKHVPYKIDDMVCLVHVPDKTRPYYKKYDIKYLGNVVDGQNTNYINVPMDIMTEMCKRSIDHKQPFWFGCDVSKYSDKTTGILDKEMMKYELIFGDSIQMTKGQKIQYYINSLNHAMIIKGYNKLNGKINRWLVENSWGEYNEMDGDMEMTMNWFEDYVLEVVIDKRFLSKKIRGTLKSNAIKLEPWDPLGLLAKKRLKGGKTLKNKEKLK
jgi:bleomycin hydrolase